MQVDNDLKQDLSFVLAVAIGGSEPSLWKNDVLLMQKIVSNLLRERLFCQAFRICCGAGKILASFRRS